MDEEEFRKFLKRGGRSQSALKRYIHHVKEFELYLAEHEKTLDEADPEDVIDFVASIEKDRTSSAKTPLLSISYYYSYTSNEKMHRMARILREERIKRVPFSLKNFRGVNPEYVKNLAALGIKNCNHMLEAGKTQNNRQELSRKTGIPIDSIVELVKLSDLARLPGVKGVRARLYYDAGVDTVEKMAGWDPEHLRDMIVDYVERTGFDGIATLPGEARYTVDKAKKMPKIVEY
jgi:hypothetical protein